MIFPLQSAEGIWTLDNNQHCIWKAYIIFKRRKRTVTYMKMLVLNKYMYFGWSARIYEIYRVLVSKGCFTEFLRPVEFECLHPYFTGWWFPYFGFPLLRLQLEREEKWCAAFFKLTASLFFACFLQLTLSGRTCWD